MKISNTILFLAAAVATIGSASAESAYIRISKGSGNDDTKGGKSDDKNNRKSDDKNNRKNDDKNDDDNKGNHNRNVCRNLDYNQCVITDKCHWYEGYCHYTNKESAYIRISKGSGNDDTKGGKSDDKNNRKSDDKNNRKNDDKNNRKNDDDYDKGKNNRNRCHYLSKDQCDITDKCYWNGYVCLYTNKESAYIRISKDGGNGGGGKGGGNDGKGDRKAGGGLPYGNDGKGNRKNDDKNNRKNDDKNNRKNDDWKKSRKNDDDWWKKGKNNRKNCYYLRYEDCLYSGYCYWSVADELCYSNQRKKSASSSEVLITYA